MSKNQSKAYILDKNPIIQEDLARICDADLPWQGLDKQTILVTGGHGFLAAYLVKTLLAISEKNQLSINVICLVRNKQNSVNRLGDYLSCDALTVIEHDISTPLPGDLPTADIVIHSASQASPKYYGVDPVGTLQANTVGTQYLLDYAVQSKAKRFLFFSSGEVYGKPLNHAAPMTESDYGYLDPMNLRSCYAESKRMGETMCVAWAEQYGLKTIVVRPFHTYGPGMHLEDGRVFADFVASVVNKQTITLKSDGLDQRAFCYIADATIGFMTALLKGNNKTAYNVANPAAEVSIRTLATTIAKLLPERHIKTTFETAKDNNAYLKSPVRRACPSIQKMHDLGWQPSMNIEDGFRRTIQSYIVNEQ